jgi:hypothetical protein
MWEDITEVQSDLKRYQKEKNITKQRLSSTKESLDILKRTNVIDDAFHISYDSHFGTINGFRLGRLQSQQVALLRSWYHSSPVGSTKYTACTARQGGLARNQRRSRTSRFAAEHARQPVQL